MLIRMLLLAQQEADRIETWQRGREGLGIEVPPERWDAGQRHRHDLFMRMAQLAYLVSLVEPEFRALVKRRVGRTPYQKTAPAPKAAAPVEEVADEPLVAAE